jgi:hypothetical protein
MPLINCIECGAQVSSQASCCPKCGKDPIGVRCDLCGDKVAVSKATGTLYEGTYHEDCLRRYIESLMKLDLICPECTADVSKMLEWGTLFRRTACKHDLQICYEGGKCPLCGYPILNSKNLIWPWHDEIAAACNECRLPVWDQIHEYCYSYSEGSRKVFHFPKCASGKLHEYPWMFSRPTIRWGRECWTCKLPVYEDQLHCYDLVWNPDDPDGAKARLFFHYPSCVRKEGDYVVRREYSGPGSENLGNPPTW